ncbi:hypothetical protein ACFQMM_22515 [Saliphagus sp. GCM10025308]
MVSCSRVRVAAALLADSAHHSKMYDGDDGLLGILKYLGIDE